MEAGVFNRGGQEQDTTVTAEAQAKLAPFVQKVCIYVCDQNRVL